MKKDDNDSPRSRGMRSLLRNGSAIIYKSHLTCIYKNLLIEDFLLQNTPPNQLCLLFYRNNDSVVIGRNQSIFAEVNLESQLDFKIARRFSGGGAVYHDLGNMNYSIIMPRPMFDRRWAAELICHALMDCNDSVHVNGRSDIYVDGKKCGGSAYRVIRDRAYHHGTFLLSSDLYKLSTALCSPVKLIDRPAVLSVPVPVTNFHPPLSAKEFIERVANEFKLRFNVQSDAVVDIEESQAKHLDILTICNSAWTVNRGPTHSFIYNSNIYRYSEGRLQNDQGCDVDARKLFSKLLQSSFPEGFVAEQNQVLAKPEITKESV